MLRYIAAGLLVTCALAAPAGARKKPPLAVWTASRVTDPITGASSCTVTASDRAAGMYLTRTGAIYPVVELNSEFGLLVGVSSGGKYRTPAGDIVWRVDVNPHHELKAADNPVGTASSALPADIAARVMKETTESMNRMIAASAATSTMASGEKARKILDEMIHGQGLIYRSASVQSFGLADPRVKQVGQVTKDGLKPIPLDESFRSALVECGISNTERP